MKTSTTRIAPGIYDYTVAGRTFRLTEIKQSERLSSRPLWHVAEVKDGLPGPPFEAATTLLDAKRWAAVAATQE